MLDPRPIIRAQVVPMGIMGVALYIWPDRLWSLVLNAPLDGVHMHMARCPASLYMAMAMMFWYWTGSTDPAPSTTCLKYYILSNAFGLAATWYARIFAAEFVYGKVIIGLMIYFATTTVFNVVVLLKSGWIIGRLEFEPERQFTQNRLQIFDTYAATYIGFLWMAYPDLLLRRQVSFPLTEHHAFVCRIFGSVLCATSAFGQDAVYFKNSQDRLMGLISRMVAISFVYASQIHSQFAYEQWWTRGHWVGMGLWILWGSIVAFCLVNNLIRKKWK